MTKKIRSAKDLPSALTAMADGLDRLARDVRKADESASAQLIPALAMEARAAAACLQSLDGQGKGGASFEDAYELAERLESIGELLLEEVRSLKPPCHSEADEGDGFPIDDLRGEVEKINDTAFEFLISAARVRDAIGVSKASTAFNPAQLRSGCGCGSAPRPKQEPVEWTGPFFDLEFNQKALEREVDRLNRLQGRLESWSKDHEGHGKKFFGPFLVAICSSACTPPNAFIAGAIRAVNIRSDNTAGTEQPAFDLDWDYCCQNICMVFWTDEFIVTVTTNHTFGAGFGPGRAGAALAAARRGAAATVAALTAVPPGVVPRGVAPAPVAPAAPVC
jgi:hypothetical protein